MQRVQRVIKRVEPHDSVDRYRKLGVECLQGNARITSPYSVEVDGKTLERVAHHGAVKLHVVGDENLGALCACLLAHGEPDFLPECVSCRLPQARAGGKGAAPIGRFEQGSASDFRTVPV